MATTKMTGISVFMTALAQSDRILNESGSVVKCYIYKPFGEVLEENGSFDNPFMFTGQYYDSEIDEYYLRARMYDPRIGRFTSRDPVQGKFKEPLTLHRYLYCLNDPINLVDPDGEYAASIIMAFITQALRKHCETHYDLVSVQKYVVVSAAIIDIVLWVNTVRWFVARGHDIQKTGSYVPVEDTNAVDAYWEWLTEGDSVSPNEPNIS